MTYQRASAYKVSRERVLCLIASLFTLAIVIFAPGTAVAKEVVDSFGEGPGVEGGQFANFDSSQAGYSDVNTTGAGPADVGDIYISDRANNRIQRFARNDHGTPSNFYDDTYEFVGAWGADVSAGSAGGNNYEICAVATECQAGVSSGGNGTAAGNGALANPVGVAVDDDTGQVFVADSDNNRVNVYAGDGTFLRSFGFDVVASGPDDNGTAYEVCDSAAGDVCKAGLAGAGSGQANHPFGIAVSQADGNATSGTVFLTDALNSRVNTYNLDGTGPSSFGSAAEIPAGNRPRTVAVDSRGIVYFDVLPEGQQILRYDSENANGDGVGFLEPIPTATIAVTGGSGNETGSNPYTFTFKGAFRRTDVSQITVSNGTTPLSGGSGASVSTITPGSAGADEVQQLKISATAGQFRLTFNGQTTKDLPYFTAPETIRDALEELSSVPAPPIPASANNGTIGLSVDPDSDGAGPDQDVLYALRTEAGPSGVQSRIYQVGPLNDPGLTAPPAASDEIHGNAIGFTFAGGLGLDRESGRLFVATSFGTKLGYEGTHIYILDSVGGLPTASLDSVSDLTPTSATVHSTVNPNGPPLVRYHLEYSLDGSDWSSTPESTVGVQETPQAVETSLDPPGGGLEPGTLYHVRLVITKAFTQPITTAEKTFTTSPSPPQAETVGSPQRAATTATLEGRVNPRGAATTYHFEYSDAGPCDANPCQSSAPLAAGAGGVIELVSEEISGLTPGVTYHYRLVADNGSAGSPAFGEDMTVTTRASDSPLSHGRFPGPSGSDRAWEQVSLPDSGGNPVIGGMSYSDDGDHAVYQNSGGSPNSDSGTGFTLYFAERTSTGWVSEQLGAPRDQAVGPNWLAPTANADLSELFTLNFNPTSQTAGLWRLRPGSAPPALLYGAPPGQYGGFYAASDDGSRDIVNLKGSVDAAHPAPPGIENLYDITSGTPKLISLLPDETASACGVDSAGDGGIPVNAAKRATRWLSADGRFLVFPSTAGTCLSNPPSSLYLRDIVAEETTKVSRAPLSGPTCHARLLKQTSGAVFFRTDSRLDSDDMAPEDCGEGSDVYRYDIGDESLDCVTCVVTGLAADAEQWAVAADGSRVYFASSTRLLAGAATPAVYRVDVESGAFAYVAPLGDGTLSDSVTSGNALTSDGSVLILRSDSPALNPVNGSQNGGNDQYYRYDDNDRSLVCVSCPQDGSIPAAAADGRLAATSFTPEVGPNSDPLDDDGGTFIFATPNSLAAPDQNTAEAGHDPAAGLDVYEWRDGRVLLVTDGLTQWSNEGIAPTPNGISPDGRDAFFTASAQYTPDALDGYVRLYDARIGGGIEFSKPPAPCPLEVCQGIPKGAPEEAAPGTGSFTGLGTQRTSSSKAGRCPKGRRKVRRQGKARCVAKKTKRQHRANNNRRASR